MIGAGTMQTMKGPTRALSTSNHVATATNDLYTAARLVAGSVSENSDCDGDGIIEAPQWRDATTQPAPANGGFLPSQIGAAKRDPWGTEVGYCVWDHGSRTVSHAVAECGGAGANRLAGTSAKSEYVIAVISAGADRVFQTTCNGWADINDDDVADIPLIDKPPGSDDIVRTETMTALFAEGGGSSDGQLEELPDDACNPSTLGTMRYDASTVQICREDGWQEVGSAIQADGNFIPVDDADLSSIHTSNAITLSGFFGERTANVEGGGGAILLVNNIAQGPSGRIKAGDTIAIRANAAGTPATAMIFTLSVSTIRRAWRISTRDPLPPTLDFTVVSGDANAMNVTYSSSTSYGAPVRFRVTNNGEAPTAALSAASFYPPTTNYEFHAAGGGDGCSGQILTGGASCFIEVRPYASTSIDFPFNTALQVTDGASSDQIMLNGSATGWPCPLPWGGMIAANAFVTTYSAVSVPCGSTCSSVAETRTCSPTTAELSGTFTNQTCTPTVCANCSVAAGATWTVSGQTCTVPSALNFNHGNSASASDSIQPTTGGITYNCSNGTPNITTSTCALTGDSTPNVFSFTDQTNVPINTLRTSNTVTITGINMATAVSVTGTGTPQISINGGGWVTSGTISNGQTLQVRLTSANTNSTGRTATVAIGGVSDTWSVTTVAPADTTPDAFTFTDLTGQPLNTVISSNSITIFGINAPTSVSISGTGTPSFRIAGGSWVTSGTITNGQTLQIRQTSANGNNTARTATITVGGVSDTWSVTTLAPTGGVWTLVGTGPPMAGDPCSCCWPDATRPCPTLGAITYCYAGGGTMTPSRKLECK